MSFFLIFQVFFVYLVHLWEFCFEILRVFIVSTFPFWFLGFKILLVLFCYFFPTFFLFRQYLKLLVFLVLFEKIFIAFFLLFLKLSLHILKFFFSVWHRRDNNYWNKYVWTQIYSLLWLKIPLHFFSVTFDYGRPFQINEIKNKEPRAIRNSFLCLIQWETFIVSLHYAHDKFCRQKVMNPTAALEFKHQLEGFWVVLWKNKSKNFVQYSSFHCSCFFLKLLK